MWAPHEQRAREVEQVKADLLTPDKDAATRVHYVPGDGVIWLDTDVGIEDGVSIGVGRTKRQAVEDAVAELRARIVDLQRELDRDVRQDRKI